MDKAQERERKERELLKFVTSYELPPRRRMPGRRERCILTKQERGYVEAWIMEAFQRVRDHEEHV